MVGISLESLGIHQVRSRYRNVLFCESPGGECWNRKIYLAQHYLLGVDKLGFLYRFGSLCISRLNWDFSGEGYLPRSVLSCRSFGGRCWDRGIMPLFTLLSWDGSERFRSRASLWEVHSILIETIRGGGLLGTYSPAVPLAGGVGNAELCRFSPPAMGWYGEVSGVPLSGWLRAIRWENITAHSLD